jgi:hypothetical protein
MSARNVQLLTFNVAAFAPIFVLGLIANKGAKTRTRPGPRRHRHRPHLLALNLIIATIKPVEKVGLRPVRDGVRRSGHRRGDRGVADLGGLFERMS